MKTNLEVNEHDGESGASPCAFEQAADEQPLSLIQEFILFLRENRKWWLIPILISLGFIASLVAISATGAAPFIYTLF